MQKHVVTYRPATRHAMNCSFWIQITRHAAFRELTTIPERSYQTISAVYQLNQFLRCTWYTRFTFIPSQILFAHDAMSVGCNDATDHWRRNVFRASRRRPVMVSTRSGRRVHARSPSASRSAAPRCRGEEEERYDWRCLAPVPRHIHLAGASTHLCARVSGSLCVARCVHTHRCIYRIRRAYTRFTLSREWPTSFSNREIQKHPCFHNLDLDDPFTSRRRRFVSYCYNALQEPSRLQEPLSC